MNKTLLIIGFVWPEPKSSAAGSRMMQLIETFLNEKFSITFATACSKSEKAFDLRSIGVECVEIELNNSSFDVFLKELNPDIVLFDRFMVEEQFGWRVSEFCPEAIRILDTEDLHSLRRGRHQAIKDNKPFDESYLYNDTAKREIASIYRCDLSLIISEEEMKILRHQFKIDANILLYLPFMFDKITDVQQDKLPKFEERDNFVTIGNFLHDPNFDAVLYLKNTIWPLIRKKLPKAEMHIYGAYVTQKVNQLHNKSEGFLIKGFAEDVNQVMHKAKVCLAPLRFGAGLKGKLFDAMLNGTPCVTTSIGGEGVYGNLDINGYLEDDPEVFAEKAVELFSNELVWAQMQQHGFNVIDQRFNLKHVQNRFLNAIKDLQEDLKKHRLKNFTGSMLLHHSLQSTKFMSKWIEEKNRNIT